MISQPHQIREPEMQEGLWQVIIAAIVSNAVALGILGFLFKAIISHFLDKDISSYRSKLDAENLKLQIAYGGIFEKQANVIIELYTKLLSLELGANPSALRTPEEWNNYKDRISDVASFYHEQRVIIPQNLDEKVLETIKKAHSILANSTNGHTPFPFAEDFRNAKEATLTEMRELISVGVHEKAGS